MDVMQAFLSAEINTQELYNDVMQFILSPHIRCGEFEGNEYIIKKMDSINFLLFPEYVYPDGHREIHAAIAVYRQPLIEAINTAASKRGFITVRLD